MKTAQDLINECNRKDSMPVFSDFGWAIIGAGILGGVIGGTIYISIILPFMK